MNLDGRKQNLQHYRSSMEAKINIAIDGYSATGKSSTAKRVAKKLGYLYVDSGAMYRAVTLYLLQNNIDIHNAVAVTDVLPNIIIDFRYNDSEQRMHTFLNGKDVEDDIRQLNVSKWVSEVSTISEVRKAMVQQQQALGKGKGIVMDGRDIGTVVFPDAELKFFMTANYDIRTLRRKNELLEKGKEESENDILENLRKRDYIDSSREDSPLTKAEDAIEIDTSDMTLDGQVNLIYDYAKQVIKSI